MGNPSAGGSSDAPVWEELTSEQQYVLTEAFEYQRLMDVLNGWAGYGPDAAYWNRKEKYVAPMILAVKAFVEWGLIESHRVSCCSFLVGD